MVRKLDVSHKKEGSSRVVIHIQVLSAVDVDIDVDVDVDHGLDYGLDLSHKKEGTSRVFIHI